MQERSFRPTESNDSAIFSFESFRQKNGTELTPKQALQVAEIVPKNMILFKFDPYIFTGGQVMKERFQVGKGERKAHGVGLK